MSGIVFTREEREEQLNRAALYRRMAESMPDEAMAERFFRLAQALQESSAIQLTRPTSSVKAAAPVQGSGWQALNDTLRAETERQKAVDPVRAALSHRHPD